MAGNNYIINNLSEKMKFNPGVVLQWPSSLVDVLDPQRFPQQEVRIEIDLPDRDVVGGSPVCMDLPQFFRRQGLPELHGLTRTCSGSRSHESTSLSDGLTLCDK